MDVNEKYKYSELTGKIIGAAMEVHKFLGNGFQELIYPRALEKEFLSRNIEAEREYSMNIFYKNQWMGERRVDFLVNKVVTVELKAVAQFDDAHLAQAINYL